MDRRRGSRCGFTHRLQVLERSLSFGVGGIVGDGRVEERDRARAVREALQGDVPAGHVEVRALDGRLGERRQGARHLESLRPPTELLVAATERLEHALRLRGQDARQLERLDGSVRVAELRLEDPRDGDELAGLLAGRGELVQAMAAQLEGAGPVLHLGRLRDERMNRRSRLRVDRSRRGQDLLDCVCGHGLRILGQPLDRRERVRVRDRGGRRHGRSPAREGEALRDRRALRARRRRVVHARDQNIGRRRARVLARVGEREAGEGDAVRGGPHRTNGREDRISARLGAEEVHGLAQDLGRQERVVGGLLVGELEDERHVGRRASLERLGERAERDAGAVAERDGVPPGEEGARVDEHGVSLIDPRNGPLDVRLRIRPGAHDDDVEPEAREPTAQPSERFAAKTRVACANVGRSDDERQPHLQPRGMYDRPPPGDEAPRASPVAFQRSLKKLQRRSGESSLDDGYLRPHDPCRVTISLSRTSS